MWLPRLNEQQSFSVNMCCNQSRAAENRSLRELFFQIPLTGEFVSFNFMAWEGFLFDFCSPPTSVPECCVRLAEVHSWDSYTPCWFHHLSPAFCCSVTFWVIFIFSVQDFLLDGNLLLGASCCFSSHDVIPVRVPSHKSTHVCKLEDGCNDQVKRGWHHLKK